MQYWYKKNKLQLLRGFCAVIEEGSALKASSKLNIAQSSISLQISSLERDLGVELFRRENQKLIPTKEALRFYKMCKRFVLELDSLFVNVKNLLAEDFENKVRIAGHSYMLSHILPPFFEKMVKRNPNIEFDIYNYNYDEALQALSAGDVDFAIYPAFSNIVPKNIVVKPFYKCVFAIGMNKNHPLVDVPEEKITWTLLSQYDFINLGKDMTAQGMKPELQNYAIKSRFKLFNGNWDICTGIVKQGLSITGADVGYAKWHPDLILKSCPQLMPNYEFSLLVKQDGVLYQSAQEMLEMLENAKF
jgi:DNA-binding transcriptional LysR family regulator